MKLPDSFFDRDAKLVARQLLGKLLCHQTPAGCLAARVIETEAYYLWDKGSHASLGYTPKRKALFSEAGTIYMYYARGADSFNISCRGEGNAVLIKSGFVWDQTTLLENGFDEAASLDFSWLSTDQIAQMQAKNPIRHPKHGPQKLRPKNKLCSGQTLLCRSMGIKVEVWDQQKLDPQRLFFDDVGIAPPVALQVTRLGIPPGRDEHLLHRFVDERFAPFATQNPLKKRGWEWGKHIHRLKEGEEPRS